MLRQRITQNLLDRPVGNIAVGLFASTSSPSHQYPVGRSVTGPAESLRIDERLQEVNRMPIHLLPVIGDPRRHAAQQMRCQMLDPHPGQDQEARVVSDEADAAASRCSVPADVAITTTKMARSR